jgi:hypothetical protein
MPIPASTAKAPKISGGATIKGEILAIARHPLFDFLHLGPHFATPDHAKDDQRHE